ncbi:hypothetical protein CEP53_006944 [Fusarium sp. AF-6]|nr:hypothetical protein CEP53_006944 [Fusarium sp. AF-6]
MASNAQAKELEFTTASLPRQPKEHVNQENTQGQIVLQVFGSHTGDNYLCRPIQVRRGLQRQSATAGPLLFLDGTTYQLTVEHVMNFGRHKSEPTWEHTNDDWDDDDEEEYEDEEDDEEEDNEDDDGYDAWGHQHVKGMVSSDFGPVRTMSERSLSSEDDEINFSGSSSSGSAEEIHISTSWSPMVSASTPASQSFSETKTVGHIIVHDCSCSPQIEPISSTHCYANAKMDCLLFPIHVSPDAELCTTGGAEMVQLSDVFDVHKQTKARPVIITTASLGYVQGIIFPAPTLLQKPGSHSFQTLFCIESVCPMPKGTSGSAVFDSQTGLLAGYLVLGCPGKRTCYMVPMCDVLAELNMFSSSIVRCQVQLNVSAIVEAQPEKSAMSPVTMFSFHAGGLYRSAPLSSMAPREEAIRENNRPVLEHPLEHEAGLSPNPTNRVDENLKTNQSPQNPPNFRPPQDDVTRITGATLECASGPADEWKERFGRTIDLSVSVENRSFIDILRENLDEVSEVEMFCYPSMLSARSERAVSHVKRFCEGASFALDVCVASDAENPTIADIQEPEAWVSDRNQDFEYPQPNYPRILDCKKLYLVLQKKRFPDSTSDDTVDRCRRIYIANPNGSSVLALLRTAPASQVEGLRQLFVDYIKPAPEPKIILRESDWWGGCFIFSFNLPFFGIQYQEDLGNISSNGKRPFRCRRNLSFLNPRNDDSTSPRPAFLHEAVWSFMVTGKSDRYWTAVFFDENPFDEEPRLEVDEGLVEDLDPIILQDEWVIKTTSPRSYALAALIPALSRIVDHHADILDWLKTSFGHQISATRQDPPAKVPPEDIQEWMGKFRDILEQVTDSHSSLLLKLDHFLSEDVMLDTDALPRGRLWRSLQSDAGSLKALLRIKQYHHELRDIEVELRRLLRKTEGGTKNSSFNQGQKLVELFRLLATLLLINPPSPSQFRAANLQSQAFGPQADNGESWDTPVAELSCNTSNTTSSDLECVADAEVDFIRRVLQSRGLAFTPTFDNFTNGPVFLDVVNQNLTAQVPILIGTNGDEGSVLASVMPRSELLLDGIFGNDTDSKRLARSAYPTDATDDELKSLITTDYTYTCTTSMITHTAASAGQRVWCYCFNASFPNNQPFPGAGVWHISEIPLVFGTYKEDNRTTAEQ